jgi:hypothetical protein
MVTGAGRQRALDRAPESERLLAEGARLEQDASDASRIHAEALPAHPRTDGE